MLAIQYDLFQTREDATIVSILAEVETVKTSCDKVRRGIFAKHNELAKAFRELKLEHELLIRSICKNETVFQSEREAIREVASP